ncbi:MAG: hypothetical protein E7355_02435 [Clostridiales bacterium]|nr:hypothetical protein [Clostridiales bacterium]
MEENLQKQNEISIMEIFRLLLSKLKLIILIVIAGALLGAGIGFLRTHNVEYYGTEMKFYINPNKNSGDAVSDSQYGIYGAYNKNVLNNMVELLDSEAFAEKLLLNEKGLPKKERLDALEKKKSTLTGKELEKFTEELNTLNTSVVTATAEVVKYENAYNELLDSLSNLNDINEQVEKRSAVLDELWNEARMKDSKLPYTPIYGVNDEIDAAINDLQNATTEQLKAESLYESWNKAVTERNKNAEDLKKEAVEKWSELDVDYYKREVGKIVSAVTYSYYDEAADASADDLARSFIYVNISVYNGEAYAMELREKLKDAVPAYIIERMPVPSGYNGTSCIRISRMDEVRRTNEGLVSSTAIKYALILGAAALLISCIVIIIIDRSDKRLRSIEQITDVFNVPVLGVIPTFQDSERVENASTKEKN